MTGQPHPNWAEAKQQALKVLIKAAQDQDPIPYSKFVKKIKAIPDLRFHEDPRLNQLLDEISIDEDQAGRGLLSVLVVELTFPRMPAPGGFWDLAEPRHPPGTPKREIFEAERDRVYRAHGVAG